MEFTVEEMNVMCAYDTSAKDGLWMEIFNSIPHTPDAGLQRILQNTLNKLAKISDEEFSQIVFSPAYEEE
jgi:hypothetical protein